MMDRRPGRLGGKLRSFDGAWLGVAWGYGAGTDVGNLDDLRAQATWARSAGFDSFWLSQVFGVDPIVRARRDRR